MSRPQTLVGRSAIVTGAAQGIGKSIANDLARHGANVLIADMDAEKAAETAALLAEQWGVKVETSIADLSIEESNLAMVDTAKTAFGQIDILVNNAGGGVIRNFLEHTPETLQTTIDRNLWTVIWGCRTVLPTMLDQGYGRIVSIGADSVRNGLWQHAAYNAAKGGVHGITTGLAREFARSGVTFNVVAPCAVRTEQVDEIMKSHPDLFDVFIGVIPMGRPGEMEEIASMVTYLAGEEASFVNGQTISVNGGSTML
ncbi:MAG TPA: 2,3-dihydroxy-2,3-dihydro-p-cumate dehydrogenase [Gammaproteobacteria bacterium]|nr:2,3-dihydroxy-2,3-dihydro-p-cumate dehydrogenase [Gammaproteobacteria bacterium]